MGIHRSPVDSPHKGTVMQKAFPCHDVPDSKVHGANMGPTWVLSAPDALWTLLSGVITVFWRLTGVAEGSRPFRMTVTDKSNPTVKDNTVTVGTGVFCTVWEKKKDHSSDVIMGTIASQITSLTSVYSAVYSDTDQRKHQSSASLAFVRGFHRGPVNYPHKWPVTLKMFPFDDVIMS